MYVYVGNIGEPLEWLNHLRSIWDGGSGTVYLIGAVLPAREGAILGGHTWRYPISLLVGTHTHTHTHTLARV